MYLSKGICPFLIGSSNGATCSMMNDLIRNIEGSAMWMCMSRRHEVCTIYYAALRNSIEAEKEKFGLPSQPG